MAIVAHLLERAQSEGDNDIRDAVSTILIAIDDAVDTTAALVQARGAIVLNANGFDLPAGYFNTNRLVLTTFDTAGDVVVVSGPKSLEAIA